VQETVAGVTTSYLVADQNLTGYAQVLDELQGSVVSRTYSYGLSLINEQQSVAGAPATSFYGFDGHGSVRFLTSSTGAITDTYDYDAFGSLIASTGSTPNNYRFAGEQFDPLLGIYYNRARYYDQRQGRFWSMDTWEGDQESPGSLHKYLYVLANPTMLIDPNGTDPDYVTPLSNIVLWLATKAVYVTTSVFGMQAHRLIEADIQMKFPGTLVEVPVPGGQIDVIIPPNEVYEIKPLGGGVDPQLQLDHYINVTNGTNLFPYGLVRGTTMFEAYIDGPYGLTEIFYYTAGPGVIYYVHFRHPKQFLLRRQ
jgi:RHS repeat-associated protein